MLPRARVLASQCRHCPALAALTLLEQALKLLPLEEFPLLEVALLQERVRQGIQEGCLPRQRQDSKLCP